MRGAGNEACVPASVLGVGTLMMLAVLALGPRLLVAWDLPLAASPPHPECAPDEGLQFWTVLHYAAGDVATWPASGSIYSAYPPLPYALHAASLAMMRSWFGDRWPARFPSSWGRLQSYTAARLGGVLLGCLTVLLAALAAEAWSGSRRLAIASGVAVALYPQLIFINGYVNADSYTIAAVAGLALALSRWATRGEGSAGVGWVGVAAGAVLLGKPTGYVALVPTMVWVLDALRRGRLRPGPAMRAVVVLAAISVPMLALNAVRNHGDPLGLGKYGALLATDYEAHPVQRLTRLPEFLRDVAQSSFGVFRNADLPLPGVFFLGAGAFFVIGLVSGVASLRRASAARRAADVGGAASGIAGRALWWLGSILVLALALVIWNGWTTDNQPQGRYLLPMLIPAWVAVTCALGAGRRALLPSWLAFLAAATIVGLGLIHGNPCI